MFPYLSADDSYDEVIDPKEADKYWEDEGARETGDYGEKKKIRQGDEEHPGPDEQKHCCEIGVWVGLALRPQNEVRPTKNRIVAIQNLVLKQRTKNNDLAAPQESDNTEVQTEKIWGALTLPVLNIITT